MRGYIESGKSEGAELVTGGSARDGEGYFVEPTLFSATDDDLDDRPRGDLRPGAGGAARTTRSRRSRAVPTTPTTAWRPGSGRATSPRHTSSPALLRAGDIWINTWSAGDPSAPFGGFKASGVGREHGREGLDAYLENKTVWVNLGA